MPDSTTHDRLIEDKLKQGNWSEHKVQGDTWFVSVSALTAHARIDGVSFTGLIDTA